MIETPTDRASPPGLSRPDRPHQWELAALVATIPAFYMALLSTHRALTMLVYGVACLVCLRVAIGEAKSMAYTATGDSTQRYQPLSGLLVLGLFLSGVLPDGDRPPFLIVRLITAMLIVFRVGASLRPWFWRGGLPYLVSLAVGVMGLCGLGFWWLEPTASTFGDGLWLAFTTAATVGYGDIVPSTPAAKIFAVFVVLMGFAVLSLVTAAIAAMWVQTEERRIEAELLRDLHLQLQEIKQELRQSRASPVEP